MRKLTKLIAAFIADYKESMDNYGNARLTVHEGLIYSKNDDLLKNYIEYQHGSPANSHR
ncbi:hypothetical protein [Niallia oryzisoli]|uniref:hypothetical protein n=1 Tax=Niallia oryzisoli TaxID=1737571 RepID=UPI0037370B35